MGLDGLLTGPGGWMAVAAIIFLVLMTNACHEGGHALVAWWAAGTSSALESASIVEGADVGATGVFVPEADGAPLTFSAEGDGTFTDAETGSTWNLLGEAVDGELAGTRLDAYVHVDTFWFAWSTFRPDTVVVTG